MKMRTLHIQKLIKQVESIMVDSGAVDAFDAADWVSQWVAEPLPALGNRKPAEYLDTTEGYKLLARI